MKLAFTAFAAFVFVTTSALLTPALLALHHVTTALQTAGIA